MQPPSVGGYPVFSVLQDAQFRVLWYVGSLGEFARWMELLVMSWLVLQATDSPFQLGLVLVFNNLPRPFLSMFTGFIADRFNRLRMLFLAQTINVLAVSVLLTLILLNLIEVWHVFVIVFLQGVARSLEDPARRTGILDIVGERRLVNAMSLEVITNTTGKMTGPLLGGILIDTVGFTGAYSFLVAIHISNWVLLVTRVRIPNIRTYDFTEPLWKGLGSTIRYAVNSPMLMGLLYVTVVMNALAFPVRQFIPVIGRDHLHVGATLVGLLLASEGLGQLLGAGIMAMTRNLQYLGRVYLVGSVAVLAMVMLFAWSPWYALASAILILGGVGQAGFSTMQSTITMLSAPQDMRGRMMGLLSVCIGVATPLGTLEIGALATVSVQWTISTNALVGLVLVLPAIFLTPMFRRPLTQTTASVPGWNPSSPRGP